MTPAKFIYVLYVGEARGMLGMLGRPESALKLSTAQIKAGLSPQKDCASLITTYRYQTHPNVFRQVTGQSPFVLQNIDCAGHTLVVGWQDWRRCGGDEPQLNPSTAPSSG